jgi:hypothetical protein
MRGDMAKTKKIEQDLVPTGKYLSEIIEAWFRTHFHNSRIAQDTESYNIAHSAKEDLKKLLSSPEVEQQPTDKE